MNLNINDLRIDPAYAARRSERYEPLTTAVGQSPCDGCAHYQRCKAELLLCRDFQRWASDGAHHTTQRVPSKARYRQTMVIA